MSGSQWEKRMSFNREQERHVVDIRVSFVTEALFSQDIGNGNSSILGWEMSQTVEAAGLGSMESLKSQT